MKIRYEGREFQQVERPLFAEMVSIEKQAKVGFGEMTDTEQTMALTLISLRRGGLALTWGDVGQLSPADLELVPDAEDESDEATGQAEGGAVPPAASAEAGEEPSSN